MTAPADDPTIAESRAISTSVDSAPVSAEPPVHGITSPAQRALQTALLALPLIVLAVGAWQFRTIVDDGWIYLRIAQNTVAGNGPVFNAGERVETYTGPVWLAILSLLGWFRPTALPWIAVLAGIMSTIAGLALAIAGSARLCRQLTSQHVLLPFGALIFVSVATVWTYASTGLETGITFLWLAACLWVLVAWARDDRIPWWGAVVLGLGPLVRPDLAVASLVFLLTAVAGSWPSRGWRGVLRVLLWAAALPVLYQAFRMLYFGQVVATTAIAKEGAKLRPGWGWDYLRNFVEPYWLVFPLAVTLVVFVIMYLRLQGTRWRMAALALPVAGILHGSFVVLVGGDYMHARLLLPAFFAILAPVSVVPLRRDFAVGLLVVPWAIVSATAFRITPGLTLPVVGIVGDQKVTPEDFGAGDVPPTWWQGDGLYARFGIIGDPVKIPAPLDARYPPTVTASIAMGLQSYAQPLDFYTYDPFGLANPLAAHLELTRRALPGHEKMVPTAWMIAQLTPPGTPVTVFDRPPFVQAPGLFEDLTPRTTGTALAEQTEYARSALQCGALAELVNAPREPLTPSRMLDNLRGSFSQTGLRVPPNPKTAYETFCGTGSGG